MSPCIGFSPKLLNLKLIMGDKSDKVTGLQVLVSCSTPKPQTILCVPLCFLCDPLCNNLKSDGSDGSDGSDVCPLARICQP